MNDVANRSSTVKAAALAAFAAALAATLLAGCSTTDPTPQEDAKNAYHAPVYRTGSNIPVGRESNDSGSSSSDSNANDLQNMIPPTRPSCGGARSCS
jgi:outer membrane protein assembly factor BamE (lipoprotein component of BamABCDE complex)